MRTTITVADDVATEMERLRREQGLGPSEAMNLLARRGMKQRGSKRNTYVHKTVPLGLRMDVHNIGEVLDFLDENESTR